MMRKCCIVSIGLLVAFGVATIAAAGGETVPQDDTAYRWNLTDLYPSYEAWASATKTVGASLDRIEAYQGHLGDSAAMLKECMDTVFGVSLKLRRVMAYASMLSDENTRESRPLEMRQEAGMIATKVAQATSFLEPEILAVGRERIEGFLTQEPGLDEYRHYLEDVLRRAPHTLGTEAEGVVAAAGLVSDTAATTYGILANADIPWPTIRLADGTEARLDQSGYTKYRSVADRADRKRVFDTFFGTWHDYQRTCGVTLYSQLKRDLFYAQVHKYPTALADALDGDNVPEAVYHTLIKATNDNLPTLQRYLRLRGRMLGIDDLRYYDIYPPLVSSDLKFPIAKAEALTLEAVAPLGPKYVETVKRGFSQRWMDVYPRPGKRSGAYSSGSVYDVHPFVLMNFNDDYESVSTLAHEWGHTMHSYLANAAQPFPTADYSIFVAEVASTFNEALLLDHMLDTAKNDDERLFYLGSALEGLRGTFFRQAMFAEFELEIHTMVEKGEALSGERLSQLYGELLRRYHGQDAGVMSIDDAYTVEWAYIPHFYYDYYVYQYATSIAAASLFAQEVMDGEPGAVDRYLGVLKAGGSEYPYQLLKEAGVDLATTTPYDALIARMNRIMDEIETILDRRARPAAK